MGFLGKLFKLNVEKLNFNRLVTTLNHKDPKIQKEAAVEISTRYYEYNRKQTLENRGKPYDEKRIH